MEYGVKPKRWEDKKWEDLSQAEKIDDLRRDVVRIFAVLQKYDDRLTQLGNVLNGLHKRLEKAGL